MSVNEVAGIGDSDSSDDGDPFREDSNKKLRKLDPDLSQSMYMRQNYYNNTSIVQLSPNVDDFTKMTSEGDSLVSVKSGSKCEEFKLNSSQVSLISDEEPRPKQRPSDYAL